MDYSRQNQTERFGEWLRRLRSERELPLRSVAAEADMDPAILSKVELGQRVPTKEQMSKLAKFFGVTETEAQARRIAEKFRQENEDNPKAAQEAVCILAEEAGIYSAESKKGTSTDRRNQNEVIPHPGPLPIEGRGRRTSR